MTGSIAVSQCGQAPNRPGHHGTVVARTVGTVAISCNEGEGKRTRGVMGKEKEKEGTEADSGNNWDSGKGVEEERREGDMRKEDRKEDDERVREKDNIGEGEGERQHERG